MLLGSQDTVLSVVFGRSCAIITYVFYVLLEKQTVFLVLWLHTQGFCLGSSCLCSLEFWVASFFSPLMCGTDEAKSKNPENSLPCLSSGPEHCSQPPFFSLSSYVVFYVMPAVIVVLRRIGKDICTPSLQKQKSPNNSLTNGVNLREDGLVLCSINDVYSNRQHSMSLPSKKLHLVRKKIILQ